MHDEVKTLLPNKLREMNEVYVELTVKVGDNLYKLDFIVKNKEWILVIDREQRLSPESGKGEGRQIPSVSKRTKD